ncbi:MAG TPA: acetylglutamate kinase [Acidimicrobiales bacterium]|nr:acetylglutamate kinase [Acidimicrobiales bacterium]
MTTPASPEAADARDAADALSAGDKAAVLVEALPYIRRFWGHTVVVKYGGNAIAAGEGQVEDPLSGFATDIVLMRSVGMRPIVVHGGGPQIGELMERLGKVPRFVGGLRVTDAETLDIARMVLVGKVNRDIVSAINVHGPLAVGVSGEDAGLISAEAKHPDLGFVGDVAAINPDILLRLISEDLIPVVATIGSDETGQAYNINADTAAGALAAAIGATKLVYLTDVDGIRTDRHDPASRLSRVTVADLESMIESGAVEGGMIPKVRSCMEAVTGGVTSAHVLDGSAPHALLLEVFTNEGVGTMVVPA